MMASSSISMPRRTPSGTLRPSASNSWDAEPLWLLRMQKEKASYLKDEPNHYAGKPESLRGTGQAHAFMVGTGATIFEQLQQSIESAEKELIIITCFWASSPSLTSLVQSLQRLSDKAQKAGNKPIKVFIGFSSLSWRQKLFQTSSLGGRLYRSEEWPQRLGLPSVHELPGLDITIKSIFVLPFSVMHPKFVIVDRKMAWLPSCNVSWEAWFEGAVVLSGAIVEQFVRFWESFWLRGQSHWPSIEGFNSPVAVPTLSSTSSDLVLNAELQDTGEMDMLFLPSPHHPYALCLPFWPSTSPKLPPPTPLTTFLRTQMQQAQQSIYIQTPNITSFVVLHELVSALENGINVSITTSSRLMILEQLVTAGTTTSRCVSWLVKQHQRLIARSGDLERGTSIGRLQVSFFKAREDSTADDPVQSHLKLTIFDNEIVVLGSQNMDRASWFTSQELGVGFFSRQFAQTVEEILSEGMHGRRTLVYDSEARN